MSTKSFRQFVADHWGKILGGALGLVVGLCILIFGFWRSVLLFLCIAVGVYLGRLLDRHEGLQGILQRIWPDNE